MFTSFGRWDDDRRGIREKDQTGRKENKGKIICIKTRKGKKENKTFTYRGDHVFVSGSLVEHDTRYCRNFNHVYCACHKLDYNSRTKVLGNNGYIRITPIYTQ